jgi:hypothetical protein
MTLIEKYSLIGNGASHIAGKRVNGIYISGPMTGYPDLNAAQFNRAEQILKAIPNHYLEIVNPVKFELGVPQHESEFERLLVRDMSIIVAKALGVVLLPNWQQSKGVRLEVATAEFLGNPVTTLEEVVSRGDEFFNEVFKPIL